MTVAMTLQSMSYLYNLMFTPLGFFKLDQTWKAAMNNFSLGLNQINLTTGVNTLRCEYFNTQNLN